MIYAIADLHGCYEQYLELLELIRFRPEDHLYVLGDVIDRGNGGIFILLDMMERENVTLLAGNHEHMAVKNMRLLTGDPTMQENLLFSSDHLLWMVNGGRSTEDAFLELSPEKQQAIIEYMKSAPLRMKVRAGDRLFHLSHTLPLWDPDGEWDKAPWIGYLWGEASYDKVYREGIYYVTGHCPTALIDPEKEGQIICRNNHIAIDCGTVFGNPLGCICLDTMEEYYTKPYGRNFFSR